MSQEEKDKNAHYNILDRVLRILFVNLHIKIKNQQMLKCVVP